MNHNDENLLNINMNNYGKETNIAANILKVAHDRWYKANWQLRILNDPNNDGMR